LYKTLPNFRLPFPSQASLARHWHLYLYRFGLPLLALLNLLPAWQPDSGPAPTDGSFGTALLLLLLWGATWLPGVARLRHIDIGVSLLIWVSFGSCLLQTALFHAAGYLDLLASFLYWAPLIAVYWGMVFHDRPYVGMAQVLLYYVAFLLVDPALVKMTGNSLFLHGMFQAIGQALVVMALIAVFTTLHAQMIENEALFLRAEHRANHDQLTGLLNRQTFSQHFPAIVRRAEEKRLDLALMLIDFDHFKSINDRYGHSVGDQMLVQVAALFELGLRVDDLLYRWGGDEFAVIMRDTDIETGMRVAERLRQKIEKFNFGLAQRVTISIGVASLQRGESAHEFFRRADQAMLGGKQGGPNLVKRADAVSSSAAAGPIQAG
jgi:diguanylate cyclase (GGDEF)-like protein